MDSKQIKTRLKQAKEAIKNKDITSALSLCKDILKEDRNNYLALVLLGAAFQESDQRDQAPNAYRKAIEVSPDQILAWQGLAAFYEKDDCDKHVEQLVPVYQHMMKLESDSSKWCGIVNKMQSLLPKLKNNDDVIANVISEHKDTKDEEKFMALYKCIVYYLSQTDAIPVQHMQLFEEVLNRSRNISEGKDNFQIYFKLLYKQNKNLELLDYGEELYGNVSESEGISEWMCKVWSEEFVENRSSVVEWCNRLQKHFTCLLQTSKDNVLALMAQGAYQISQRAYLEARESLEACITLNRGLFHAMCLLAEANVQLLCPVRAVEHAQAATALRPDSVFPKAVLIKALALTDDTENWKKVVSLASEVLGSSVSELAAEGLCEAHLRLQQWKDLLSAVSSVTHAPALAAFYQLEGSVEGRGPDLLVSLTQNPPECPEAFYRLGLLYLADQQYNLACTSFLKCAKLAPHWYTAYRQLGDLYSRVPVTLDKARRCYQRALVLNPADISTQMALSDTYWALGDAKSNLSLLEGVCQGLEGKWAWPRLGLQYSRLGDSTSAINCLRSALKTDPCNSHLWEALADAYLSRGANGSALKSYQKVLELKPGTFYPALQIASIKQITDLPEESLIEFRELVKQQPTSILALKGLCDTCICLTKNFLTRRLLGLSRDRLQEGLVAIASALEVRPEIACLWKLAGDCLTMAGSLPRSWHFLKVPEVLCSNKTDNQTLNGPQLLELGARCLCRCLKLMTGAGKGLVWHDLALNYRQQATLSEGDGAASLCQRALAAAKESVTLSPLCWQHWNMLGVVASMPEVKKYALAQHAFIKATTLDDKVAVPWFNLGRLYLSLSELKLANLVFSVAQRIDSEFCPSWVGQALIAELVNNEETMDLFRHTTQLGYNKESCVGYAQWVCQTLLRSDTKNYEYSIEKMHAVPAAIDALTWATNEEEDDACALNMLGCLLERSGLLRSSVEVLSRAVDHSPEAHRDKTLANFGRVLLKAGKVQDAIQVYRTITKADIHSQCGLALALFKGKLYEEAYEAYDAALNWWAADDTVKAHLNVALAAVAYKMAGPDQAKNLLLQGNQYKPPSVHGLFATCALGMLNGDLELSKLVLKDLLPYQNQAEFLPHIALFQAYVNFIQGDLQGSVWSMSRTVHRQPALAALWLHLALLILHKQGVSMDSPQKVMVAAQCALTAITLGRTSMDVSKVLAVVSLSLLMGGEVRQALSASQHAVHLYPAVGESWAVLAASCYAANQPTPLRPLISHARQHIDLERPLAKWMSSFERKIAMSAASS